MFKKKDTTAEIIKVYINAIVYQIWTERNARKHNGNKSEAKFIMEKVVRDTKIYLQAQLTKVVDTVSARVLLDRIGLQFDFKPRHVLHCSWIAPTVDVIQLSCDGSVEKDITGYIWWALKGH
ncbi:hypothetical protein FRX31_026383 [Thalictrum thalictroides]|uniref:Uncharacterized protein n=1 Tax=Thalictrum thalictroides TaxID=46969 RepID=A0A7J6VIA6_THATH|nr:hypothetical protein FRX31_026383 [Thalictrum thalictroides]